MKTLVIAALLILCCVDAFGGPHLTVIFEYTVAADGSRRDIHVVRVEDPHTRQEVKGALTPHEQQAGVSIVAKRKQLSPKDAGKKLYEINLFDVASHQYLTQ